MALFEGLKAFPKVDLHVDFFGSIPKNTIYKLTKNTQEEVDSIVEFDSLKDYDNSKELVRSLLNSYDKIELALNELIDSLKQDNIIYSEIFVNLDFFIKKLDKKEILKRIITIIKKETNYNIVLEIESGLTKEMLYEDLNLLYEYYRKGVSGVYFKKNKLDSLESFKALFDKFLKDDIKYIVLLDSKLTNQNKEIYYHASRIIYNVMEMPDSTFIDQIRSESILLEFALTYQNYFHLYEDLSSHIVYDLFKDNLPICFTTVDRTALDTDLLNEYCKLFNVFPFSLHSLVVITLNILNQINLDTDLKNTLITDFKEKANELL